MSDPRLVLEDASTDFTCSAKPGSSVSVNGTDFLWLDECTGLIKRYDLAQDNISKFHGLGYTSIPV